MNYALSMLPVQIQIEVVRPDSSTAKENDDGKKGKKKGEGLDELNLLLIETLAI